MKKVQATYKNSASLDELKKQIYNKIINDKEFYSLLIQEGFSTEEILNNILQINDFYEDFLLNKSIKTYDECLKLNKKHRFVLVKNEYGEVEHQFILFDAYKEIANYKNRFLAMDFDIVKYNLDFEERYFAKNLDGNFTHPLKKYAYLINKLYKEQNCWIYLEGAHNSGKTDLVISFINKLIEEENLNNIVFLKSKTLVDKILSTYNQSGYDKSEYQKMIDKIGDCELLVIDDFGSEIISSQSRDLVFIPILSMRNQNGKKTIFTSQKDVDEIENEYNKYITYNNGQTKLMFEIIRKNIAKNKAITVSNEPLFN